MLEDTKGRTKGNIKGRLKKNKETKLKFWLCCVILNAYEQIAPIIFILNKGFCPKRNEEFLQNL